MKRQCIFGLFFVVLSGTAVATRAQSDVDTARVYSLGVVSVYGSRAVQEVIPVQTLAGRELQRLSVHSVADAARYFSGVQLKDYGGVGGLKTVNIRSMGSQHTGVFYDGVELGNAQNGTVDLGRFSLDNMESVALYNGQKSAILQPAKDFAAASALYMTTRIPVFDSVKPYNIRLKLKSGSFGTLNPSLLWEHRLGPTLATAFSAEYLYTTGRYHFSYRKKDGYDTTEVRRNGDVSAIRIEQGLYGKIGGGDWKAKAYYYNSQRGYPGAAVREEPGTFKHQDRQWDSDFFLQTSWRKNVHERYDLLLNGKYAYNYLHYRSDPNMDATTMYIDNHYRQQELYGSCANRWSITDRWSAGLSIDVQRNTLTADMRDFVEPTRLTGLAAAATALHLPHFTMQADILATLVHDRMKTEATTHNRQKLTPSIAMSWQPVETLNFNIRSFYKSIFRMPTLNDLYYTFIGNSALAPEKTVQYNIGMTFTAPIGAGQSLEFQADVYRNDVTDKIIAMPASNQFRWTMVNLGKVEIRGLDLSTAVSRQIGHDDGIHCRLNYTYQKAQDFTNPESSYYGDYIPYIPLHSGSAVAGGNIGRWEFNYSFLYTGERWNASANIPENHEKQWYTSDVSASGTFQWGQRTVRLTAEVNNLFNQQYEVVQCYPMPGTNFYILLCINI